MKRFFLLLALVLTSLSSLRAQSLRVGYYGETVTHYGFRLAYDRPLLQKVRERNQARKILYGSLGLAAYRHPANHYGLILSPELGYRRIGRRGSIFELAVAPAYFRYFLDGTTYEATPTGDFRKVPGAGGNAFLPTIGLGIGRDLSVRHGLPLSWYTRLNVMQQRPYNTTALLRFSLELGTLISLR